MEQSGKQAARHLSISNMLPADRAEVANLIYHSTNGWYQQHYGVSIFSGSAGDTDLFCEVYETLDPGCCLVARQSGDQKILGSCFYHPRQTHVSLGILNVHPQAFGKGVARALLTEVIQLANRQELPLRLVSSVMNLDSYSLYNRAGLIPRQLYQDMILKIPDGGWKELDPVDSIDPPVLPATLEDVDEMVEFEGRISGIRRPQDIRYFIENQLGIWSCCIKRGSDGLEGWCASIAHPASTMIGPCLAINEHVTRELLKYQIQQLAGHTAVFLLPAECQGLIQSAYRWGARNCEMHVLQVLGEFPGFQGIFLPTFMPETA